MDDNNSNSKQHFWGTPDLDEDEDLPKLYNQSQNTNIKPTTMPVKPTGPLKKAKSTNNSVITAPVVEETNLQQGSFHLTYNSDDEINNLSNPQLGINSSDILKLKSPDINYDETPEPTDYNLCNLPVPLNRNINNAQTVPMMPIRMFSPLNALMPNLNINLNRPLMYGNSTSYNYSQQFMHRNNFQFASLNNANVSKSNHIGVNYQTTYMQRLDVVDALFKFIIQILRSPEKPSVDQIMYLKRMLDSLVVDTFDKQTTN